MEPNFNRKLFLHIGMNKTGSSFLQSSLVHNREVLRKQGFYLPESIWDDDMRKGIITPGNGNKLAKLLADNDERRLIKYINDLFTKSEKQGLSNVILSNETLIRILSYVENRKLLIKCCEKFQVDVKCCCFLREPHSHALSLFKHRAKSGMFSSYKEWLNEDYETVRLYEIFKKDYEYSRLSCLYSLYKKDGNLLLNVFYSKFLNISQYNIKSKMHVNKSLNLKGIFILQVFEAYIRGSSVYLHKELQDLSSTEDEGFLLSFKRAFKDFSQRYFHVYSFISSLLDDPNDRKDFMAELYFNENSVIYNSHTLSIKKDELEAIGMALSKFMKDKNILRLKKLYRKLFEGLSLRRKKNGKSFKKKYGGTLRYP